MVFTWCVGVLIGVALAPFIEWPPLLVCGWGFLWLCLGCFRPFRPTVALGTSVFLGLWLVSSQPLGPEFSGRIVIQGVIASAAQGKEADVFVGRHTRIGGDWAEGSGRVSVRFKDTPPRIGLPVLIMGRAVGVMRPVLPGAPDPVISARRAGVRTRIIAEDSAILGPGRRPWLIPRHVEDGVMAAVAVGDRSRIDPEVKNLLRNTGTAHLLAISGFHVGVVGLGAASICVFLFRLVALWYRPGIPTWLGDLLGAAIGVCYVMVVGAPISAQRAACALVLWSILKMLGWRVKARSILGLIAVAILCVDPAAIGSVSFQLSFGAVWGMLWFSPHLHAWVPQDWPRWLKKCVRALSYSTGAMLGTLPICAWWFQQWAPVSPIANLMAIPIMGMWVIPAAMLSAWGPAMCAGWASSAGEVGLHLLYALLQPISGGLLFPALSAWGPLLWLLPFCWPGRWSLWLWAIVCTFALKPLPPGELWVTFLDVGQGDAIFVEQADGKRWLVDGGYSKTSVLKWLRRQGVTRLDRVVASHPQQDHIGGLLPPLEALDVGELWLSETDGFDDLVEVATRKQVSVMYPDDLGVKQPPKGANDRSLVVQLGKDVLLTGDIEKAGEALFLANTESGRVALLKVPHHGSKTSSGEAFIDHTCPVIAVISAGLDNRYGHPSPEVLSRYSDRGVVIYRTDQDGTVQVRFQDEGLGVRTHQGGTGWSAWKDYPMREDRCARLAPIKNTPNAKIATHREIP